MNIAVVDDNKEDQDMIAGYIKKYCTEHQIHSRIHAFSNGPDFLAALLKETFNMVFLDIYMNGDTGIQIAEKIHLHDPDIIIIFSTSSNSHAIEGFRVRAFDYLLKPYSYERFMQTMEHCNQILLKHSQYIEVKEGRYYTKVLLSDIIYVDYYNHYIQIHTKAHLIRSYMSFAEFAPLLTCYPQFLTCYRNCLVNMDKIESLDEKDFIMITGERVPISRGMKNTVRQTYADYVFHCVNGDF